MGREGIGKWMDRLTDVMTILVGISALAIVGRVFLSPSTPVPGEPVMIEEFDNWEPLAEGGHRKGPENASVVIVEFGDYQCPFCREAESHLAAILRSFPDVAVVYRHRPLAGHASAYPAARAAECAARQGLFWEFHEALFSTSAWQWGPDWATPLTGIAEAIGVADVPTFAVCLKEAGPVEAILSDEAAAISVGATGTPTFLINGRKYVGVVDSTEFTGIYEDLAR